ncbi:hypothetical protein LSCM4_05354 [Leishmania orientalis]|uniref:Uncharacterized protein n=1 Tax=Leishmania orientalis TaxID=2249476 RepID=A0A836GQ55_9TRYP|nr:hypothetical protein LSCM4_05354 [Leishmania orientalis]
MLRLSRVALFIVPSRSSPELTHLRRRGTKPTVTTSGELYAFVIEYDHRGAIPRFCRGPYRGDFFSTAAFSGSLAAGILTAGGVALFTLTFGYNIGKPVVDAHRELFWKSADAARGNRSLESLERAAAKKNGRDDVTPVEEFDDHIELEQDEGQLHSHTK